MKITRPGAVPSSGATGSHRARNAARKAAVERDLTRYLVLTCGHYTTRQDIEAYSCWQPRRGVYFCETCGRWKRAKARQGSVPVPDIPMF